MQNSTEPQRETGDKVQDVEQPPRKPDDRGSVNVDGFVRIFDPNTQQVFLETRT